MLIWFLYGSFQRFQNLCCIHTFSESYSQKLFEVSKFSKLCSFQEVGNSIWLKYLKDDWSSKMSEKGLSAYLIQQRLFLLYIYFTNNLLILSTATTKALSNKRGYLQNPKCFTVRTWNPKIFNMISLVVGSMGRTTHRPSVWCSKYYLFS